MIMKNLNHTELIELTAAEAGVSKAEAERVLRAALDVIGRHVVAGFRVNITNFGTWYRSEVAPRIRSIPGTDEEWRQSRTKYPRFKYAPFFTEAVKDGEVPVTLKKRGHNLAK
jgi:DNA-binding protein HU-beta